MWWNWRDIGSKTFKKQEKHNTRKLNDTDRLESGYIYCTSAVANKSLFLTPIVFHLAGQSWGTCV